MLDAVDVKRRVACERTRLNRQRDADAGRNASADRPSKSVEQRFVELDFVLSLLDEDPSERRTAAEILEAAKFGDAAENDDLVTMLDNVSALRIRASFSISSLRRSSLVEAWRMTAPTVWADG